jgi:hypothetical protein
VCVFSPWGRSRNLRWIFLLAACLLLCVLNTTKQVDGDLINYVRVQDYLAERPLLVLLQTDEMSGVNPTYRPTEMGFYAVQWLMAQLFDSSSASIAVAATLAIYIPTFAAILLLARVKGWNDRLTLIIALVAFFAALNFNNTTNLLRQYVSAAFALLALVSYFDRKKLAAFAWALLSCSVHNGTAYLMACFIALAWLFPFGRAFWTWGTVWRALCAILVLGGSVAALWFHGINGLLESTDLSVWRYLVALLLFAMFLYAARSRGFDRADYYLSLAYSVIIFVSAAFYAMSLRVMALRYFVYLEGLYAPMVAAMLCAIPRRHLLAYLGSRWLVCCAAACVFIFRVNNPPGGWTYGPDSARVLTISAREAIEYIGT